MKRAPDGYRAILFDLDGTLLDSAALIITAFQETCRTHLDREVDRATVLNGWSQTIRQRFSAIAPDRADALVQDYLARYLNLAIYGRFEPRRRAM